MADDFKIGVQCIMTQGALIAMLPIEEWIEQLQRADAIAPILDPTLYRDWIWSVNSEVLPEVLRAALVFKHAIQAAQRKVLADAETRARRAEHDDRS